VLDAEVQEVRIVLGKEVPDPHDPLGIPEGHGGHGALLAAHLRALAHAGSINDRGVIRKHAALQVSAAGQIIRRTERAIGPRLGNGTVT
jgi:hypothetical protein